MQLKKKKELFPEERSKIQALLVKGKITFIMMPVAQKVSLS